MDKLDAKLYYTYKKSMRKLIHKITTDELPWREMPVVLVDFYSWEAHCFANKFEAKEYIREVHLDSYETPPKGEDEALLLMKFCTQEEVEKYPSVYRNYEFFKEMNGKRIYREKSFVEFEPELIININI